jgi:methanogenic corrinoid protein MtbC1
LAGDEGLVRDIVARGLRSGHSRCAVFDTLLIPCLHQIGELWERGEIAVPDEHLASHTLTCVLHDLRPPPVTSPDAPTAVVSCAPLESHTIPALMAGDLLADAGWRVWQLGASAPAVELATFVRLRDPRLLVLTTSLTRHVTGVVSVTRALRDHTGTAVLAGGAGVRHVGEPSVIGADALGHRLADLLTFAGAVASGSPASPASPVVPRPAVAVDGVTSAACTLEHVATALHEAGTPLSISEIRECCGATSSQVGIALSRLERAGRVRFTGGRWKACSGDAS